MSIEATCSSTSVPRERTHSLMPMMMKLIIPCLALLLLFAGPKGPGEAPRERIRSATTKPTTSPATTPASKLVKLPGLLINVEEGYVDVDAVVCLKEGALELVACAKGTKEHESIVAIDARPMLMHTALLLLGANNGHPVFQKPANEQKTQWLDLPPEGDRIDVSLVIADADGQVKERPVSDFMAPTDDALADHRAQPGKTQPATAPARKPAPRTFVFAGSRLHQQENDQRQYLADASGNVISLVTFGDEVLCLPSIESQENDLLQWRVDATHLPEVGTKVALRLRPRKATPLLNKP